MLVYTSNNTIESIILLFAIALISLDVTIIIIILIHKKVKFTLHAKGELLVSYTLANSTVSVVPPSVTPPTTISWLSGRTAVKQSYRPVVM